MRIWMRVRIWTRDARACAYARCACVRMSGGLTCAHAHAQRYFEAWSGARAPISAATLPGTPPRRGLRGTARHDDHGEKHNRNAYDGFFLCLRIPGIIPEEPASYPEYFAVLPRYSVEPLVRTA